MTMSQDDLLIELMQTFQLEAAEHLATLNGALLKLERGPAAALRQELLQESFRTAHSLKGAARAVGLMPVERVAHGLEDVLKLAREGKLELAPATCDTLYHALDLIKALLEGKSGDVEGMFAQLASLSGNGSDADVQTTGDAPPLPAQAPEPEAPTDDTPLPITAGEETVRVAISKLDALMAQTGELLVSKISAEQRLAEIQHIRRQLAPWSKTWREIKKLLPRLTDENARQLADVLNRFYEQQQAVIRDLNTLNQAFNRDTMRLDMVTADLQNQVRHARMVPFQTLAGGFERAVRDVAHSQGKQVRFIVTGGEVELDKKVLESLKDPLLHLLRNAVTHGIETPDVRCVQGKPAEGRVTLSAQQRGAEVRILVDDDGRGFDLSALRQAGVRHGERLEDTSSANEVLALAFLPGVSTAREVTSIAGRGFGLDVVRQKLDDLQGRILVDNRPGKGVTIQLIVPVSLSMARALLLQVAGQQYALPLVSVEKILEPGDVYTVENQAMLNINGVSLPLVSLAAILHMDTSRETRTPLAVIIGSAEQRLALLVDDVLTEQELAVKPLGKPLQHVRNVSGAALLGNGEPVIILSASELIKSARGVRAPAFIPQLIEDEEADRLNAQILVVDDSITTRTLEKNILEAAGYVVMTATDGLEALKRLKETHVDLVVTDVQMPNMDGVNLTRHLREQQEFAQLPIILVTSLESREDRENGMLAGANAYIVKRGFNQAELLATIQQLL